MTDIKKVLVANRGVITKRIMRTCKEIGLTTIGIYSQNDLNFNSFSYADQIFSVEDIGDSSAYMNVEAIIKLAVENDAAIHPGYGFLSESYDFARRCLEANVIFIGPSPEVLKIAGNKIYCHKLLKENNIPVVESISCNQYSDGLFEKVEELGFPILLKPAHGGGGIGMTVVTDKNEFENKLKAVMEMSKKYFGNSDLLIEKYLTGAKHIEVQLVVDKSGEIFHLFERECSMQRRNQKVIEETPSPSINDTQRNELYELAIHIGKIIKLDNIATIEFLFHNNKFYFLEINPRLQVEHAVTEELTGIDLVELQIKIASDKKIDIKPVKKDIHVIEVRVYAEDSITKLPCPGTISYLSLPDGNNLRIESYLETDLKITESFDPLLMKLITTANTRDLARKRMINALVNLDINSFDSLKTNVMALLTALESKVFIDGNYNCNSFEKLEITDSLSEKSIAELLVNTINFKNKVKIIASSNNTTSFWQPSFWQKR